MNVDTLSTVAALCANVLASHQLALHNLANACNNARSLLPARTLR